jgi:ACT domain-containing protein
MARIITHADITRVADGGTLYIEPGAQLTPLAAERVKARGISVQVGAPPGLSLAQDVAERVLSRLVPPGTEVDPPVIERVVAEVMGALGESPGEAGRGDPINVGAPTPSADYCAAYLEAERHRARRRAILTTTGRNQKGIVARLTTVIAEMNGDILDLSQTLVGDYFTMILVVDTAELSASFAAFKGAIEEVGRQMGFQCMVMHEDVVTALGRV